MSKAEAKSSEFKVPDAADIEAAVRRLAAAHEPTRAQLEADEEEARHREHKRMLEALLFASNKPLGVETLRMRLPEGADVVALLAELVEEYAERGVNLVRAAGKWRFQTAPELAVILRQDHSAPKKLSQAALETMAIIAYHQPATRAEIEAVRGVSVSPGTLDALLELGWVRPRGRRRAPGRPLVYVTTEEFLEHFSLESLEDLPGKADLKAAGLLSEDAPDDFEVPDPTIGALQDELPLEDEPEGPEAEFQTDYMEGAEAEDSGEDTAEDDDEAE